MLRILLSAGLAVMLMVSAAQARPVDYNDPQNHGPYRTDIPSQPVNPGLTPTNGYYNGQELNNGYDIGQGYNTGNYNGQGGYYPNSGYNTGQVFNTGGIVQSLLNGFLNGGWR